MSSAYLLLLAACQTPAPPPPDGPLSIYAAVATTDTPSGEPVALTVELLAPEGAELQLQPPSAEGLVVTPTGQEGPTPSGERLRQIFRYDLTGPDGSYVIQPGAAAMLGDDGQPGEPAIAPPIFIDLGVEGPSGGELAGFAELDPEPALPWLWIGLGAGALLLACGLSAAWLLRPRPPEAPEPPESIARRRWTAARSAGLDDPALALALSAVFRDYLQQRHGFSAQANTSREIVASLEQRSLVTVSERLKLESILQASDRLKYGRDGGGPAFFDALEAAFEDILRAGERAAAEVPDA